MTSSPFAAALVAALLHSLWQDSLLALLAALSFRLLARHGAAHRHAAAMVLLAGMLLLPLVTLSAELGSGTAETVILSVSIIPGVSISGAVVPEPIEPALWLGWLWALGVAAMLVRIVAGVTLVRRLDRRPFAPLPPIWAVRVETRRRRLGIGRAVDVRLLDDRTPPCTGGLSRPIIWLPLSILTGLGPDQIEAVIAHELAHIRRLDWVWNAMQCAVETLLFYHPAMWWLSRRIRAEREHACDDLAVGQCGDPLILAEALGGLARLRRPALALTLSTNGSPLMKRVKRLLTPAMHHRSGWKWPAGVIALSCSGVVLAMTFTPAVRHAPGTQVATPHLWEAFGEQAMDLNATVAGTRRTYRHWVDLRGRPHESYAVDGRPAPIDAAVRRWIGLAAIVPPPPAPSAPPRLHRIGDDPLYQAAVRRLATDPSLVARLGSPVAIKGIAGPSYMDEARVELTLQASGPKGAVQLHRIGAVDDGRWTFRTSIAGMPGAAPVRQ